MLAGYASRQVVFVALAQASSSADTVKRAIDLGSVTVIRVTWQRLSVTLVVTLVTHDWRLEDGFCGTSLPCASHKLLRR